MPLPISPFVLPWTYVLYKQTDMLTKNLSVVIQSSTNNSLHANNQFQSIINLKSNIVIEIIRFQWIH